MQLISVEETDTMEQRNAGAAAAAVAATAAAAKANVLPHRYRCRYLTP
jgi:hypothetical protein